MVQTRAMHQTYSYSESGRRPGMWFMLGLSIGFVTLALLNDAPWIVTAVTGLALSLSAWAVLANPEWGSEVSNGVWRHYGPNVGVEHALEEIDHIAIREWSDSADFALTLRSGERVSIPSPCVPVSNQLAAELTGTGVDVSLI